MLHRCMIQAFHLALMLSSTLAFRGMALARNVPLISNCRRHSSIVAERTSAEQRGGLSPIIICGPSGVGKGTLIASLLEAGGDVLAFAVSHTTRRPRLGEVEGREYFFTTRVEMEKRVGRGEFLESVEVHGNLYGTSFAEVQRVLGEGRICVLDVDTQGVQAVSNRPGLSFSPHFIFIRPPSVEALRKRLRQRATESTEQIEVRLTDSI